MHFAFHLNAAFYICGSVLFLFGSILFHPNFLVDEHLYRTAVSFFAIGSLLFLLAPSQQLLDDFRAVIFKPLTLSTETNVFNVDLAISLCRNTSGILGGILFLVGSAAFWPSFGSSGALVGNWLYRFGSIFALFSSLGSLIRQQEQNPSITVSKVLTFFSFLGSLGFIIGGAFFLAGKPYGVHGCVSWALGSVVFLLSSLLIYKV